MSDPHNFGRLWMLPQVSANGTTDDLAPGVPFRHLGRALPSPNQRQI